MPGLNYPEGFFDFGHGMSNDDSEVQEMIDDCFEYIQNKWEMEGFRDVASYARTGRTLVSVFAYLEGEWNIDDGVPPKFTMRVYVTHGGESLIVGGYTPPVPPKWERPSSF